MTEYNNLPSSTEIIELYDEGMDLWEIANELGCSVFLVEDTIFEYYQGI